MFSTDVLAILGGFLIAIVVFALFFAALIIASSWVLFTKAGEKGWKALIPVYNEYIMYKLTWHTSYFWIMFAASMVSGFLSYFDESGIVLFCVLLMDILLIVLSIVAEIKVAKAYGQSGAFAIGLILLPFIFYPILAFGDSKYIGPQEDEFTKKYVIPKIEKNQPES